MCGRLVTALLVAASCVGAQSARAQAGAGRDGTSFGVVGGLNLATLTGADNDLSGVSPSSHLGAYAGVAATVPIGTNLFFQPHALFSRQGPKYEEGGENLTVKLDYVQVPLFLGVRIPMQGSSVRPYVMAGPYVAFKLGCKYTSSPGSGMGSGDCSDLGGEDIESMDYGLAVGAGVEIGAFALSARFGMGIADLVKDTKAHNSVISFGAGYFFGR